MSGRKRVHVITTLLMVCAEFHTVLEFIRPALNDFRMRNIIAIADIPAGKSVSNLLTSFADY